jgi:hypothetical protein
MRKLILAIPAYLAILVVSVPAQQSSNEPKPKPQNSEAVCPMHDTHSRMNERGEQGMGFSQTATTHHFFLKTDGGVVQVESNSATDVTNRDNIRMHLTHIAHAFASGDFDIPMFVHDTVPPGVPEMKRLREKIHYSFEETPTGARVVITTANKESLIAIHKFLRFQIDEHRTGDPTVVP